MLDQKYSVAVAVSGAQAMASIGKKKPDLILLDYEMPVCDGRMTMEMIRKEEYPCSASAEAGSVFFEACHAGKAVEGD